MQAVKFAVSQGSKKLKKLTYLCIAATVSLSANVLAAVLLSYLVEDTALFILQKHTIWRALEFLHMFVLLALIGGHDLTLLPLPRTTQVHISELQGQLTCSDRI